eukprot:931272-Amphidinium_carterae.1
MLDAAADWSLLTLHTRSSVSLIEVIQSDFARLEADTSAAEVSAQKDLCEMSGGSCELKVRAVMLSSLQTQEYDTFMTDSEVDKAQKNKDIEHKTAKKQDQEQALVVKHEDLEGTQKELDAALAYYDKLKPSCVDAAWSTVVHGGGGPHPQTMGGVITGVSYDDRVNRRKEEIESLQEALRILNGEEIA